MIRRRAPAALLIQCALCVRPTAAARSLQTCHHCPLLEIFSAARLPSRRRCYAAEPGADFPATWKIHMRRIPDPTLQCALRLQRLDLSSPLTCMCFVSFILGRTASASAASRRGARRSSRARRTRARRPTRSPSATRRRRAQASRPAARAVRPCGGCGRPTRSCAPAPTPPTSASAGTLFCAMQLGVCDRWRAQMFCVHSGNALQAIGQQLCKGVAQLPAQPQGRRCALVAKQSKPDVRVGNSE